MTLHPDILRDFIRFHIAPLPEAACALVAHAAEEAEERHRMSGAKEGSQRQEVRLPNAEMQRIYGDPEAHGAYEPSAEDWHRLYTYKMVTGTPGRYGLAVEVPTTGDDAKLYVQVYRRLQKEIRDNGNAKTQKALINDSVEYINHGFKSGKLKSQAKDRLSHNIKQIKPEAVRQSVLRWKAASRAAVDYRRHDGFANFLAWAKMQPLPAGIPSDEEIAEWPSESWIDFTEWDENQPSAELSAYSLPDHIEGWNGKSVEDASRVQTGASAWTHYNAWVEAGDDRRSDAARKLKTLFLDLQNGKYSAHVVEIYHGSPLPSSARKELYLQCLVNRICGYQYPEQRILSQPSVDLFARVSKDADKTLSKLHSFDVERLGNLDCVKLAEVLSIHPREIKDVFPLSVEMMSVLISLSRGSPVRVDDGRGLSMSMQPDEKASWIFTQTRICSAQEIFDLGWCEDTDLKDARRMADIAWAAFAAGIDVVTLRKMLIDQSAAGL